MPFGRVRNLSVVLQDVKLVLTEREPDPRERADLESIANGCRKVLEDLEKTLDKYCELEPEPKSFGRGMKRLWKRLKWEPEDIAEYRSRIISNVTLLNAFSGRFTRDRVVKLLRHHEDRLQHVALDWLTPIDYAPQHNALSSQRLAGSCQWFLDSPEFKAWVKTEKQTLFCPGILGAGKTILTSAVVDELINQFANDENIGIAYIYCGSQQKDEQKAEDFLASLLKQLVECRPAPSESVKSLYDKHKDKRTRPSLDDISAALHSTATAYSRVFIIVDALDECPAAGGCRSRFMSEIFALQPKCGANIYATSKFIGEITIKFSQSITKEIRASYEDVQLYIEAHMGQLPSFVQGNQQLQGMIKAKISTAVGGMFLLARIYLDSLEDKLTVSAIKRALKELPEQHRGSSEGQSPADQKASELLHLAYEQAMRRIDGQKPGFRDLARKVLAWITCTKRPLSASELQHALAIKEDTFALDEDNLPQIEDMVSVCAGLVAVDDESGIIRLDHYSAHEYLKGVQKDWFPDAETEIMATCIAYLSFSAFQSGFCTDDDKFEDRLRKYPFYDYAARNWGHHARTALSLGASSDRILPILENDAKLSASVQAMMVFQRYPHFSRHVPMEMTGVHVAAYFGLLDAIKGLREKGLDLEAKDSYGRTPLSWASQRGNEEVVTWLLNNKADPNSKATAPFMDGCTPLWFAAQNGHEAVVKVLLAKPGVEWDSPIVDGQTPLSRAARNGHEAIVRLLLNHRVKINLPDKNGQTPLSLAAKNGHDAVVQALLDMDQVDVNAKDNSGRTPLSLAAENGREAVVKALLDADQIDVNAKDNSGRTPLSYAKKNGHGLIVQLLTKVAGPKPQN
ncbi:hypothetical protein NW767_014970 [Fusarium falciforme]|nr:hypothetical protein NW767_014970 [Fusarium falciforme]